MRDYENSQRTIYRRSNASESSLTDSEDDSAEGNTKGGNTSMDVDECVSSSVYNLADETDVLLDIQKLRLVTPWEAMRKKRNKAVRTWMLGKLLDTPFCFACPD